MGQIVHVDAYRPALLSTDGSKVTPDADGYVTLAVGTYFVPLGGNASPTISAEVQTGALLAASAITIECTNAPKTGPGSSSDWDNSASSPWVKDDSVVNGSLSSNGTGWTATALSMVKTAGVGCAIWNLHGRGAKRYRMRLAVTTAGTARIADHSKTGA